VRGNKESRPHEAVLGIKAEGSCKMDVVDFLFVLFSFFHIFFFGARRGEEEERGKCSLVH
jgi:hypothetical protein